MENIQKINFTQYCTLNLPESADTSRRAPLVDRKNSFKRKDKRKRFILHFLTKTIASHFTYLKWIVTDITILRKKKSSLIEVIIYICMFFMLFYIRNVYSIILLNDFLYLKITAIFRKMCSTYSLIQTNTRDLLQRSSHWIEWKNVGEEAKLSQLKDVTVSWLAPVTLTSLLVSHSSLFLSKIVHRVTSIYSRSHSAS